MVEYAPPYRRPGRRDTTAYGGRLDAFDGFSFSDGLRGARPGLYSAPSPIRGGRDDHSGARRRCCSRRSLTRRDRRRGRSVARRMSGSNAIRPRSASCRRVVTAPDLADEEARALAHAAPSRTSSIRDTTRPRPGERLGRRRSCDVVRNHRRVHRPGRGSRTWSFTVTRCYVPAELVPDEWMHRHRAPSAPPRCARDLQPLPRCRAARSPPTAHPGPECGADGSVEPGEQLA